MFMPSGVAAATPDGVHNLMISAPFAPQLVGFRGISHPPENMSPNLFNANNRWQCLQMSCPLNGTAPFEFTLDELNIPDTDASWISLEVTGTFLGGTNPRTVTYTRSNRTSVNSGSNATAWEFNQASSNDALVDGESYNTVLNY